MLPLENFIRLQVSVTVFAERISLKGLCKPGRYRPFVP